MNTIDRQRAILLELKKNGSVNILELTDKLAASSMTIRRDLAKFASEGICTIVTGGAILNNGSLFEFSSDIKQDENTAEKKQIASAAYKYINDGDSIFLDSGTTVKELADLIKDRSNTVILTHSLLVGISLADKKNVRLIMCPGEYRKASMAYMGALTIEFLKNYKIDTLFLGVEGVDLVNGVSVPDILDGATKKALVEKASKVICLADHTKFNKSFLYSISPIDKINTIITDADIDSETLKLYKENNIDVVVAERL